MRGFTVSIEKHHHDSFDGTRIAWYRAGTGPRRMAIASGLGTPILAWKHVVERFAREYTMLLWDPRGTYGSAAPADPAALRVEDHAGDLGSLVGALGWDRFVLGGWSMGVQVCLEYAHRHPDQVLGLFLLNGAYEHVLATAFGLPGAPRLLRGLLKAGEKAGPGLQPVVARLAQLELGPKLMHRIGLVRGNPEFFGQIAREFSSLDWPTFFRLLQRLDEHSAAPLLSSIRVPTLVTAGSHDRMTPVATAEALHRGIPGAELFLIPGGTHYALVEYPELLNLRLGRFLDRVEARSAA